MWTLLWHLSTSSYTCSTCRSPGAPGGHVCLSGNLLHYIYAVHQKLGYIHVSCLTDTCMSLCYYSFHIFLSLHHNSTLNWINFQFRFGLPIPMLDQLQESSHRDDSYNCSNIEIGQEITQVESIEVNFTLIFRSSEYLLQSCALLNWIYFRFRCGTGKLKCHRFLTTFCYIKERCT